LVSFRSGVRVVVVVMESFSQEWLKEILKQELSGWIENYDFCHYISRYSAFQNDLVV
jgi:hypothetical protein